MPGIHNKASCDALGSGYTPCHFAQWVMEWSEIFKRKTNKRSLEAHKLPKDNQGAYIISAFVCFTSTCQSTCMIYILLNASL
jgi:hypothetical protein